VHEHGVLLAFDKTPVVAGQPRVPLRRTLSQGLAKVVQHAELVDIRFRAGARPQPRQDQDCTLLDLRAR